MASHLDLSWFAQAFLEGVVLKEFRERRAVIAEERYRKMLVASVDSNFRLKGTHEKFLADILAVWKKYRTKRAIILADVMEEYGLLEAV